MKAIHLQRLKKFADYIKEISDEMLVLDPQLIYFYDESKKIGWECYYHSWVFQDMPWIHQGFEFRGKTLLRVTDVKTGENDWITIDGNPVYAPTTMGQSNQDPFRGATASSVLHYYGLTPEQFMHLFGRGQWAQQPHRYSGQRYPQDVTAKDIAENIYHFIKIMEKEIKMENYNRLLKFADFLAGQEDPLQKDIVPITFRIKLTPAGKAWNAKVFWHIFYYLPDCFIEGPDDWYIDSFNGEVIYGPSEGADTISCVYSFFGLKNVEEFIELFAVNEELTEKSTTKEIAQNIVRWVTERKDHG